MKHLAFLLLACFLIGTLPEPSHSQTLEPTETDALINLTFSDFSHNPRSGDSVIFISQKTGKTHTAITDTSGRASFLLPRGDSYRNIIRMSSGDTVDYGVVELRAGKGRMTMTLERQYAVKTFVLEHVFFDFGKATLKKESFSALDELHQSLVFNDSMVIEIAGHTDNIGSDEANMKLSLARANNVRAYLLKQGSPPDRVLARGYGETQPVADNTSEEGRKHNRRTEVRILKE